MLLAIHFKWFTDLPVWRIQPKHQNAVTEGKVNVVTFDLTVDVNIYRSEISGSGLWKLSAWTSGDSEGKGNRISYNEQVIKGSRMRSTQNTSIVFRTH